MRKWIFFPLNNSPPPIRLCSLSLPAAPFCSTTVFSLRSATHQHDKLKRKKRKKEKKREREKKKQTENNNKPTNLIFSSTGSQPFTNIFLPRPTPNDPILKLTTEKKYCIYLKIQWRGSPPWGLKVQRIAWTFARPCCPQRVNSGQVTMLS